MGSAYWRQVPAAKSVGAPFGAVAKASEDRRHIRWFQVLETRGHVEDGKVAHYQVMLKLGYTLEE